MTPAITQLRAAGVAFTVHEYERSGELHDFGVEAATALGVDAAQVFKTLVLTADGELVVAIVPVSGRVALKAVGTAIGVKRVEMCDPRIAERTTGYVRGGISPFGQRQSLRTVVDESAIAHDVVYVSGGRRGLDIAVAPADVERVLGATFAPIAG